MPRGNLGARQVSLSVHEASMSLIEATEGFVDSLGPANLAGANLEGASLRRSRLHGAILCRTVMPDGRTDDSGCE